MFAWEHLIVFGLACDIAGAVILAWSFSAKRPEQIPREIPIHGMTFGLPRLARSLARQRAEARLGLVLLVTGFALQAFTYFIPHLDAELESWRERAVAGGLVAVTWAASFVAVRTYVPWDERRTYSDTERRDHSSGDIAPHAEE